MDQPEKLLFPQPANYQAALSMSFMWLFLFGLGCYWAEFVLWEVEAVHLLFVSAGPSLTREKLCLLK